MVKDGYDFESLAACRTVFIKTYFRFCASPPRFRDFGSVPSPQALIKWYELDERFVGLHVARCNNTVATGASPLSAFVDLMAQEIDGDVRVAFLLATDSPEAEGACLRGAKLVRAGMRMESEP